MSDVYLYVKYWDPLKKTDEALRLLATRLLGSDRVVGIDRQQQFFVLTFSDRVVVEHNDFADEAGVHR